MTRRFIKSQQHCQNVLFSYLFGHSVLRETPRRIRVRRLRNHQEGRRLCLSGIFERDRILFLVDFFVRIPGIRGFLLSSKRFLRSPNHTFKSNDRSCEPTKLPLVVLPRTGNQSLCIMGLIDESSPIGYYYLDLPKTLLIFFSWNVQALSRSAEELFVSGIYSFIFFDDFVA